MIGKTVENFVKLRMYLLCIVNIVFYFDCTIRDFDDGMFEMVCTFENFDVEILKLSVPYKYVVYSPKAKKDDDRYEYLHAHSTWRVDFNRCLFIRAQDRPAAGGKFSDYLVLSHIA